MKLIIIEDEFPAMEALSLLLARDFPEITLCGIAHSVAEALPLLKNEQPDLILLDIQLRDGTGFEIAEKAIESGIWVIFTTGFEEYAIQAFKYLALDYILKPISSEDLRKSFSKMKFALPVSQTQIQTAFRTYQTGKPEVLLLRDMEGAHFVNPKEVSFCKSFKNYTDFHLTDGKTLTISKTLRHFEEVLEPLGFFRIHNQFLINLALVESFLTGEGGMVRMKSGITLEVARRRKAQLMTLLGIS